jgi:hypothetical protein
MRMSSDQRCGGLSRRDFVRVGSLSALGLGLADLLALRAGAENASTGATRAKHCILIWLDGGPSHLETFDLKPQGANLRIAPGDREAPRPRGDYPLDDLAAWRA